MSYREGVKENIQESGKAYTRGRDKQALLYVPRRDHDEMKRKGWVTCADLVAVPQIEVVFEVDQERLIARPIGLATLTTNIKRVITAARTPSKDRLVRSGDLVDYAAIGKRTGRHKNTIYDLWRRHADWPSPVVTVGNGVHVFSWHDVLAFMDRHDYKIDRNKVDRHKKKGG